MFSGIWRGNHAAVPGRRVVEALDARFPGARQIEWFQPEADLFEAVFIHDAREKIALFLSTGDWKETRVNCPVYEAPDWTREVTGEEELMNLIEIIRPEDTQYELIVRDRELRRFLLLVSSGKKVLSRTSLASRELDV